MRVVGACDERQKRPRPQRRVAGFRLLYAAAFAIGLLLSSLPPSRAMDGVPGEATAIVENGFGRLLFRFAADVESQARLAGNILIINFRVPVDVNVDKLRASAPDYIAQARRDPDGRGVRIALARRVTLNSMSVAERLFVDLLPETWTGPPPGLPREVIEELARRARDAERKVRQQRREAPQVKLATIRVRVATQPTFTRYTFELPRPIGVVSNNEKNHLTLVFNALLKFDLADAKATLPPGVSAIDSEVDGESVVVRFSFSGTVDVRMFREDLSYVVDVASMAPKNASANKTVDPDALPALAKEAAKESPAVTGVEPPKAASATPATNSPPTAVPAGQPAVSAPAPQAPVSQAPPVQRPPAQTPSAQLPSAQASSEASVSPSVSASAMAQAPPRGADEAPAVRPRAPAAGDVSVSLNRQGDNLSLTFPFATATPAAMFLRADTLWLIFDTDAVIGLAALERDISRTIKTANQSRFGDAAVVRIKLERPRLVSAATEGPAWTVTIGAEILEPSRPLGISRNLVSRSRSSITIPFEDPRRLHRIPDPEVGDILLVVSAVGPPRGFIKSQDFVELRTLASVHGVALQPHADDLTTELAVDKIVITRPQGLTLSPALNGGPRSASIVYQPHVIDAQAWSFDRQADFSERTSQLIRAAAEAKDGKRLIARAELARFYLAREMANEAKGVLDVALAESPPSAEDATPLVLRGVAHILSGRPELGLKDLANPLVGNQHDAPLWRALANARLGKWSEAREGFRNVGMAMGTLPIEMQRTLLKEMTRASLEVGDITGAVNQMRELEAVGVPREYEPAVSVLTGRIEEGLGHVDDALRAYRAAADSWDRPAAAQGRLREVVLKRSIDALTRPDAIAELETLTTIWRGDETEVEALQLLARLYTEEGRYRDAFQIMRTAKSAHPNSEITRRMHDEAAETFDGLFLADKADKLPAIDALGLFYDYRELTPIGRRGDEMIRRLADRLVAIDLLDKAAELLQHQVDHRLQGAARASIATKLAAIYLTNRKPDRALATLRATRIGDLSNELRNHRLLLESRALSELGRHELALEIVANLEGREVIRLRSDVMWAAKQWNQAAEQIELLYGERWNEFEPLTASERVDIMRAAIGYALGDDMVGLMRFRERYAGKMGEGAERRAFDVVTAPIGTSGPEFREIARSMSLVDTLDGFLRDLRERYSDRAPALPAPPAPAKSPEGKPDPATTGSVTPELMNATPAAR